MLMGKKGGAATPTSLVLVEAGDTKAEVEGHFDPAIHDGICGVLALVDGFSVSQVAAVVSEAAIKYPKTLFIVVADEPAIEQLAAWMGESLGAAFPVGTVFAVAGKNLNHDSTAPATWQVGVTVANAKAKILAVIDSVMSAGQGVSPGQRGFASAGPATNGFKRGLAGSAPASAQTGGGIFGSLLSGARQRRVLR